MKLRFTQDLNKVVDKHKRVYDVKRVVICGREFFSYTTKKKEIEKNKVKIVYPF